jgi:hypothetical protein
VPLVTTYKDYACTVLYTSQITIGHITFSQSVSSGVQRWTFSFLWVAELSPASATSFSQLNHSGYLTAIGKVKFKVMLRPTVSRPVCLGIKHPICGLRPDLYYCQTVPGLLIWGALSDERAGLWFTITPGPRQHSHFQVRVPWDS